MDINVCGGLSTGLRHFRLLTDQSQDWFPITAARSSDTLAAAMRSRGIPVGDPADQRALLQRIRDLTDFPPVDIANVSGWRGLAYVLPTGPAIVPDGQSQPEIGFPKSNSLQRTGKPLRWKNRVASVMVGRPIGAFALMLAFLPPLLRFMPLVPNATFELVGPAGSGKATLRNAVSSIFGGTGANGSQHYWQSIETAIDKLDDTIQSCRDRLLVFDGTHVLPHLIDPKKLGKPYVTLAFNIARGDLAAKDAPPGALG